MKVFGHFLIYYLFGPNIKKVLAWHESVFLQGEHNILIITFNHCEIKAGMSKAGKGQEKNFIKLK